LDSIHADSEVVFTLWRFLVDVLSIRSYVGRTTFRLLSLREAVKDA
jgi:hypothetical protein